jgi:hypothetical protein
MKAADSRDAPKVKTALLQAFTNEVTAQSGKSLTVPQADTLIELAQSL